MFKLSVVEKKVGLEIKYSENVISEIMKFIVEECLKQEYPIITIDYTQCNISNRQINEHLFYIISAMNELDKIQAMFVKLPDDFEPLFKGKFVNWGKINSDNAKELNNSDLKEHVKC